MAGALTAMIGIIGSEAMGLSASPNPCDGSLKSTASSAVVTSATCTVSGFVGAVSWTRVSGDATIAISSSTGTTVNWSATVDSGFPKTAVWRVTNNGNPYDVTITLTFTSLA